MFTIITIVYNGEGLLKGTIESVKNQTFNDVEYLIIDGDSKDNSLSIIQQYAALMPNLRWISEPDKGLYDAMNKGLKLASGEFILFLNCGDHLHAPDTLAKIAAVAQPDTDVFYGDTMLVDEARNPVGKMSELSTKKLPKTLHWRDYLKGMLVVHQSFLARRTLAPAYISGNLCADYDWCISILKKSRRNTFVDIIVSDYLMGGVSKKKHQQSLKDRFQIMRKHFGLFSTVIAHIYIVFRAIYHSIVRVGRKKY